MKEVEVKKVEKQYICENCGAKHKKKVDVFTCPYSGKEICTKCGIKVRLWKYDWENFTDTLVHPSIVKRGYDSWQLEYVRAIDAAEKEFYDKLEDINKRYLANDEDYFRKFIQL